MRGDMSRGLMGLAELKNHERELYLFQLRVGVAGVAVLIAFGLLFARFFHLQVVQHDTYAAKAEENRISIVPIAPNRGLILDRNGVVLARNYSAYTLEIFPAKVKDLERTIQELANRGKDSLPELEELVAKVPVEHAVRDAVWALTRIDDPEARRIVRLALTDKELTVKLAAIHSAGSSGFSPIWNSGGMPPAGSSIGQAAVTRQITSPTSSHSSTLPSLPSAVPTGRPCENFSSGDRKPVRMSTASPLGLPPAKGTKIMR